MDTNKPLEERRKYDRTPVNFLVYYKISSPVVVRIEVGDREIVALAADISEGGLAITTDCKLPPVTTVSVRFLMMNYSAYIEDRKSRIMTCRGEVRYNISMKEGRGYRIGVMFLDMPGGDRNHIRQFVSMNNQPAKTIK